MVLAKKPQRRRADALSTVKEEDLLPQLGDGGHSFGYKNSSVCFWKDDIAVCVASQSESQKPPQKITEEFLRIILATLTEK